MYHAAIVSYVNKPKRKISYAAHSDSHYAADLESNFLTHTKNSKQKVAVICVKDRF